MVIAVAHFFVFLQALEGWTGTRLLVLRLTGEIMGKITLFILACMSVAAWAGAAFAADNDPPQYWAVTGVAANDVLNVRDVPDGDAKKTGSIPFNAHGLKHIGCMTPTPSMDRWMTMTPAEKANAKLEWCRIEYKGRQGWVAARFLKPDVGPSAGVSGSTGAAPAFSGH